MRRAVDFMPKSSEGARTKFANGRYRMSELHSGFAVLPAMQEWYEASRAEPWTLDSDKLGEPL